MRKFFCLIAILVFFAIGSVFAQTTQELRIGSFLSGNLSRSQEIWYSVRTTQTCILSVETESNIDTYLEAYTAQRVLITENDDGPNGLDARINLLAQANTTYLFKLRGLHSDVSGSFRILADSRPITELRIGSPVSGNITSGGEYIYSVRATQNGYLIVETSGDTDTYLTAYDENYNWLAEDDDGAGYPNARIRLQVSTGKNYIFAVKGFGDSGGAYRISAASQGYPAATALNVGSFLNGNIALNGEYWYSVRASQSGFITVETSGNTDTYLTAYDDGYNVIGYDDDSAGGGNARLRIQVAAGGTYYFQLRGYSSEITGSYRILANYQAFPTPTPITVGSFINGNIEYEGEIWYSVRTTRSGRLTVETSGSTDTVLDAYSSDYQHIDRNDDNEDLNARIGINNVSANTTYIFRLTSFGAGPFRIYAIME
ncbi:MAG: PPC domain-containing protein [Treponema sp.]|nr:PPC domain-containing protein [Treponema sp.]